MGKIPEYGVNKVSLSPIAGVKKSANVDARHFGADENLGRMGNALSNVGRAAFQIGSEKQSVINRSKTRDIFNQARKDMLDARIEMLKKKSRAGTNVTEDAEKAINSIKEKYSSQLENDEMRTSFDLQYQSLAQGHREIATTHQARQAEIYKQETLDADSKIETDYAVNNRLRPELVNQSRAAIVANTREKYRGMGAEIVQAKVNEALTAFHMVMVDAKENDDPKEALEYLTEHKEEINPLLYSERKAQLEQHKKHNDARGIAQGLFNSGKSFEEQLNEIMDIEDAGVAQEARRWLKTYHSEREAIKVHEYKSKVENFFREFDKNPVIGQIPEWLNKRERDAAWRQREAFLEAARQGKTDIDTDDDVYFKLYEVANYNPDEFKKLNLNLYADKLSKADRKSLTKMQVDLIKGNEVSDTVFKRRITEVFNSKNLDKKSEKFRKIMVKGLEMLNRLPEEKRHDIKRQYEIIGALMIEGEFDGEGWIYDENMDILKAMDVEDEKDIPFVPDSRPDSIPDKATFNLKTLRYEYGNRQWDYTGNEVTE